MSTEAGEILDATTSAQEPALQPKADGQTAQAPEAQTPQAAPQDPKLAGRLEILMRREQGILQKEKSLKDLEASLQEKISQLERFNKAKEGNAKEALDLLGLDYNQLSESILKDGQIPPEVGIKKLEDKIKQLEGLRSQDQEQREQERLQLQKQAETKAVTDFKTEISTYVTDNKPRYELSHFEYGDEIQDIIYDVIDEHYNRTINPETGSGKVLSLKEAADKVEEFLEKKYAKAKEADKVKALWGAIPKTAQDTLAKQLQKTSQTPKTLTNNMTPAPSVKTHRPPEDERVRGIVAKFRAEKGL